jgi:ABC-type nitrate/sulfonate/bicarbonate transport system ATPase subunit
MIDIGIASKLYAAKGGAGSHLAIADLNLSLNPGEFVCLVGPSGCGKTTLLNIIAGLDQDYAGSIRFDQAGSSLGTAKTRMAAPKIGFVFQNPRLLPWRTVRENIDLVIGDVTTADNVDALLSAMQLTGFQQAYPGRVSLGMQRRAAIIRAFAINPELLLMDEPLVSLDAATARQVKTQLMALWRQRPHTVLFVTHDLREAIELADRIVFLSAAPMRVAGETVVTIPRKDRESENAIEAFRNQIVAKYPGLK